MTNYDKLINTLKEVFMLDKADLDFGIYRIMNQKRSEIENFLQNELVPQVKQVLAENLSVDKKALQKELDEAMQQARALGADPDTLPKVMALKKRLGEAGDIEGLENEVFSLLANFFKRYFDNGDFISMRRYKKDVYAIPYEGEEVKLHWANADQYYIKTSEYFKNYRFKLREDKSVNFELVEAETEQNNNKIQGDKERKFAIYKEQPVLVDRNELKIFFTYEAMDKKAKQDDLLAEAFDVIKPSVPADFLQLFEKLPTEKDKDRTLLQKHLKDYAVRNTFDYFIHKDLHGFLTRELDFYIKNEVLFIDDINTKDEQEFLKQLSKIKAVKKIGEKVIAFLAQLENFQKKLWLKKKFVIETNYCITLDRVPEILYKEIVRNEAQIDEWVKLFAIDEIKAGKTNEMFANNATAFTRPLAETFLKENKFLLLDTAFFDDDFKSTLIASIEHFDEQCVGVLVNSDNFQALTLLQERYEAQANAIYIDPPYNTSASEILYKNNYKHSSWLCLMSDRLALGKTLLKHNGVKTVTIDEVELKELYFLLESLYTRENMAGVIAIRINPSGRPTVDGLALSHEYAIVCRNSTASKILKIGRTEDQQKRYDLEDEDGVYETRNFRREGSNSNREDGKRQWYPIYVDRESLMLRIPNMEWNDDTELWTILDPAQTSEDIIYPINDDGVEKNWRWSWENVIKDYTQFSAKRQRAAGIQVYYKYRPNQEGVTPLTFWADAKYSATEHGTKPLKDILPNSNFSYPKSIYAVEDTLIITGLKKKQGLVIDYFGGSGTTAHAVINLNRQDRGVRKYVLVEMGTYFDTVTKPRVQKVIYSKEWKDGKPVGREGISHCFKYLRLESYEDTLNNLSLTRKDKQTLALDNNPAFKEGYMLNYMLDVEARDSLLNLDWFTDPFNCYLNITRNNEIQPTKIDMVETFNYLIGLVLEHSYSAKGYRVITGKNLDGEKILVVWRNIKEHNNDALNEFLKKSRYNPLDTEFNRIYVNGDNNVENLKTGDETWKVVMIEEEFKKRMFEIM